MDTRASLVCATVGVSVHGSEDRAAVNGSEKDVCEDCGCDVWVSPSGRAMQAEHGAILRCIGCTTSFVTQHSGSVELANVTQAQIKEIEDAFRRALL